MSTQTYSLGQEIQYKGANWIVVRIVSSQALIQDDDDEQASLVTEDYIQLRGTNGDYEFVTLTQTDEPFKCTSTIKPIPAVPWRVRK